MTETVVDLSATGSFSIDHIGKFNRIDPTTMRWRIPGGDAADVVFRAGNAFVHYIVDGDRLLALLASEYSPEVYVLDPVSSPRMRIATELRRFDGDAGMMHLKLISLGGDALIYYEQGLARIGLNGEVRWIAEPFPLGCSLDSIEADVIRLTCPDDRQHAVSLSSGRRIRQ